jgi:predicted enzyme related to lactoylglutathione lyase
MLRVEGMRAVNWNAPDPAAAERFYTTLFGGQVVVRNQVRGHDVTRVKIGDVIIGIFDASESPCSGVPHQTLRMGWPAKQDAVVAELEAAGVPVQGTRPHNNEVGFSIFVNDPIGNRLELSYDPPDVTPG